MYSLPNSLTKSGASSAPLVNLLHEGKFRTATFLIPYLYIIAETQYRNRDKGCEDISP